DPDQGPPVYLSYLYTQPSPTWALMSFDEGSVQFFDADGTLGRFKLGAGADSLWAALGSVLDTDPLLRKPRPEVIPPDTASLPQWVYVDELPEAFERRA